MFRASEHPRLFVFAGFPPEGRGGGAVILRSLLREYPSDRLYWFSLGAAGAARQSWWRPSVVRGRAPAVRGRRIRAVDRLYGRLGYKLEAAWGAAAAQRAAARFAAEVCWGILDYNLAPALNLFMRRSGIPTHVSVHDDPIVAALMEQSPVPPSGIAALFNDCMALAASRDAISDRLARHYEALFHAPCGVMTRGLERPCRPSRPLAEDGRFRVVMGGWSGSPPPWPANLAEASRIVAATLAMPVEFHLFDRRVQIDAAGFQLRDPVPEPEFDRFLATVDAGYACDPMTTIGRRFAATSLSTKIVTYIGSGVPFLYHGPRDSTVGDLLLDYRAGVIVESDRAEDLARGFIQIRANHAAMRAECLRAAAQRFDAQMLSHRLVGCLRAAAHPAQPAGSPRSELTHSAVSP